MNQHKKVRTYSINDYKVDMKYTWPDENLYDFSDYTYVLTSNTIHVYGDAELTVTQKSTQKQLTKIIKSVQFGNNFVAGLLSLVRELEREKRYETIQN